MSIHTDCPNCKEPLKHFRSNGVEGKFILADLTPVNEQGIRPIKDGLVVEVYTCDNCGFVFPKLFQE
ncbi:hypothetical protein [Virgibacillus halodenitrificans]|uniref:hypothetical protein n=1 Tax=Virgibacillus halodenitrificans TaxID=1482 RepID=UPI0002FCA8EE|nr:hypothetical protein [Virgibacillus halodenitrificans]